jgi:uncharacterized protein YbjT (DUF2867 family)
MGNTTSKKPGTSMRVANPPNRNGNGNEWENFGNLFLDTDGRHGTLYLKASVAQLEELIKSASRQYTIVRSTQFFEFMRATADAATDGDIVRVPTANLQPIAAKDVAAALTEVAVSDPVNGVIEIAGPEKIKFPELIRAVLAADNDPRKVVGEEHARYFGTELTDTSITPGPDAHLGKTSFAEWLAHNRK